MLHVLVLLAALAAPPLPATNVYATHDLGSAAVISAHAGNSCGYTGWIASDKYRMVALEVSFTDAGTNAATAMTATCQSSSSSATSNGSGYEIDGGTLTCTTGAAAACTRTISKETITHALPQTTTTTRFNMTLTDIPNKYVNCYVCATSGAAGDSYSVNRIGVSP